MDERMREQVRLQALGRCEYCRLPEAHVRTPFHTEHIVARQHGGRDVFSNLVHACQGCNLHKGPNLTGIDFKTQKLTKLFNPRRHKWERHFRWEGALLIGKTAVGRTTVMVLSMNDPGRVALRKELFDQGLMTPE
jgi:hypothetical protein